MNKIILLLRIKKSVRLVKDRPIDKLAHQILFLQKAFIEEGDRLCGFLFTQLNPDRDACEGEAGRFSSKCLICRGLKISCLKAYEVALCRMVLRYLSAACNYFVWTLLHCAFWDEKRSSIREERERGHRLSQRMTAGMKQRGKKMPFQTDFYCSEAWNFGILKHGVKHMPF